LSTHCDTEVDNEEVASARHEPYIESKCVTVDQLDTRSINVVSETKAVVNAKQVNQSVVNPSFDDLQYIDVMLSDESGNCSEVIRAVVDSGAEMCVLRQDVVDTLDCLTVGKVTLRGITGEPFDTEVKRVYIGDACKKQGMLPVACACHELVHDQWLLTPAVVNCLISNDPKQMDQNDNFSSGNSNDQCCDNGDFYYHNVDDNIIPNANVVNENLTDIQGGSECHQNDETQDNVVKCITKNTNNMSDELQIPSVSGSVLTSQNKCSDSTGCHTVSNQSHLVTTVEPDTLKFMVSCLVKLRTRL